MVVHRGPVLRADVVALPHRLRGVVTLPEDGQQSGVRHRVGIEDDPDDLVVAGRAGAHLVVERVLGVAPCVAHLQPAVLHVNTHSILNTVEAKYL